LLLVRAAQDGAQHGAKLLGAFGHHAIHAQRDEEVKNALLLVEADAKSGRLELGEKKLSRSGANTAAYY
jgi:hypothetical protein